MACKKTVILFLGLCLVFGEFLYAQGYSTIEDYLKNILAKSEHIERKEIPLTREQKQRISERLAEPPQEDHLTVYIGKTREKTDAFCLIVSAQGKHGPITFIVGITPKGEIKDIGVLESMEVKGNKIGKRRFLRQFEGKSLKDPIKLRQDIDAVTGATVSSAAATKAARKALILWEELGFKPE